MTYLTPSLIPLWRHDTLIGFAIVDQEDFEELNKYAWRLDAGRYACSKEGGMHRIIAGNPEGQIVDHINGIRIDNRKSNLRVATHALNNMNRRGRKNIKGVRIDKRDGKYDAMIMSHGIKYGLGRYETEKEGGLAYDSAARQIHGEFASLNFPEEPNYFEGIDWVKLAENRKERKNRTLDMDKAREIRIDYSNGMIQKDICIKYSATPGIVSLIVNNKSYKERDPEITRSAIEMMINSFNDEEIARKLKIGRWSAKAIREENGHLNFPKPKSIVVWPRRISLEKQEEAVRAFLGGRKGFEVAAEYEVSPQYLSHFVRAYKLKFPDWETSL